MSPHAIDRARLAEVMRMELHAGCHSEGEGRFCVMEAVAYVAGERWSDTPLCACPVISMFLRSWNDGLPDAERTTLLRDLIPQLVGTKSTAEVEHRRSLMAADWLVRTHTPAWLRLGGLTAQADELASLPEITSTAQVANIRGSIKAARRGATAAWDAARHAATVAAWDAAQAAAHAPLWATATTAVEASAGDAAEQAAWAPAWSAALADARVAARDAARAAARVAARDAAWDAVRGAAWAKLAKTRRNLQQSARELIHRMLNLGSSANAGAPR